MTGQRKFYLFCCRPTCIPISIISILITLVITLSFLDHKWESDKQSEESAVFTACQTSCQARLVESIPIGLEFNSSYATHQSTYDAWVELISLAKEEINIGSMYWSLQGKEYDHPSAAEGKDIFARLKEAGLTGKIKIQIAQDLDSKSFPNFDTHDLEEAGAAEVRRLNFSRLLGSGILHTKLWIVDGIHAYVGSANSDWRSLTQVKELGILVTNCPCWVQDFEKLFDVYWLLGEKDSKIPKVWPVGLTTKYNAGNPMSIAFNGTSYGTFVSSSPKSFCPEGRSVDLDSILKIIDEASEFVHIAVMDYFPATLYTKTPEYWPEIDNRLRVAAIDRKVKIKLLMSNWTDTRPAAFNFLRSLADLNGVYPGVDVEIKLFTVPSTPDQAKIPYARVNHNKYMVTEKTGYVGTSNWSADYFISTAGAGVIITPKGNGTENDLRVQLQRIFERDWYSKYSSSFLTN